MDGFEGKVQVVWQVADLPRGDYRPAGYRGVILPLLVLRRLDAVLEETQPKVLARAEQLNGVTDNPDVLLRDAAGVPFYNVSPLTSSKLLDSPNNLAQQLRAYIGAFSPGAAQVLERYRRFGRLIKAVTENEPFAEAVQKVISKESWQAAPRKHEEQAA